MALLHQVASGDIEPAAVSPVPLTPVLLRMLAAAGGRPADDGGGGPRAPSAARGRRPAAGHRRRPRRAAAALPDEEATAWKEAAPAGMVATDQPPVDAAGACGRSGGYRGGRGLAPAAGPPLAVRRRATHGARRPPRRRATAAAAPVSSPCSRCRRGRGRAGARLSRAQQEDPTSPRSPVPTPRRPPSGLATASTGPTSSAAPPRARPRRARLPTCRRRRRTPAAPDADASARRRPRAPVGHRRPPAELRVRGPGLLRPAAGDLDAGWDALTDRATRTTTARSRSSYAVLLGRHRPTCGRQRRRRRRPRARSRRRSPTTSRTAGCSSSARPTASSRRTASSRSTGPRCSAACSAEAASRPARRPPACRGAPTAPDVRGSASGAGVSADLAASPDRLAHLSGCLACDGVPRGSASPTATR